MWSRCPDVRHMITLFGKTYPLPRFQMLYGEARYSYSGMTLTPEPEVPELVQKCIRYARDRFPSSLEEQGQHWNGALVNWYTSGADYVSQHADDERDLVASEPILSFSFGAVRTFSVQAKPTTVLPYVQEMKIPTYHGSLVVMAGHCQREFVHGIPKTKVDVGPRINVTVRALLVHESKKKQRVASS